MGYTTEFDGEFQLSRDLTSSERKRLNDFCENRHGGNMKPDPGCPGFWCDWRFSDNTMSWNGNEKSYDMVAWGNYLITEFLKPWGISITGMIYASGEQRGDIWAMKARGDVVNRIEGMMTFKEMPDA